MTPIGRTTAAQSARIVATAVLLFLWFETLLGVWSSAATGLYALFWYCSPTDETSSSTPEASLDGMPGIVRLSSGDCLSGSGGSSWVSDVAPERS